MCYRVCAVARVVELPECAVAIEYKLYNCVSSMNYTTTYTSTDLYGA